MTDPATGDGRAIGSPWAAVSPKVLMSGNTAIVLKPFRVFIGARTDSRRGNVKRVPAPRVGYIKLPNTLGWDLKYANHDVLPDGSRRIVIVTDKPVSFFAARNQTRTMDYPFTLIEMRFPAEGDKGEGKLLNMTSISTKDGKLQLELYGQEPTRLTTITEQKGKS